MIKSIPSLILLLLLAACSLVPAPVSTPTQLEKGSPTNMSPKTDTLNIAHRGARSLAPENTLLAAQKGFDAGADLWELDVAMTSDGEIVVIHDDTLERTSNAAQIYADRRPWNVENFSLAELRRLDFGSWFLEKDPFKTIASGAVSQQEAQSFVGLPIPTLREALTLTRNLGWRVNVEIKDLTGKPGDTTIVERVVQMVEEMGMQSRVLISSFNHSYIQRVRQANALIYTAALVEMPVSDPLALLQGLKAQAYNPYIKTMKFEEIAPLRQAGKDVFVWTVNDEPTMRKLIAAGVSGIFTDYPQLLKSVLLAY